MRVVLDTNVLVSALIVERRPPALLIEAWLEGAFDLLISRHQLDKMGMGRFAIDTHPPSSSPHLEDPRGGEMLR